MQIKWWSLFVYRELPDMGMRGPDEVLRPDLLRDLRPSQDPAVPHHAGGRQGQSRARAPRSKRYERETRAAAQAG